MRIRSLAIAILLAPSNVPAQCQSTCVSPDGYRVKEGGSFSNQPFGGFTGTSHFQQIHGDLSGNRLLIKGLSFRANDGDPSLRREVTAEIWMGYGSFRNMTGAFATNYTRPKTLVQKRGRISLPTLRPTTSKPEPFKVSVPFTTSWLFDSNPGEDLVWEYRHTASTSPGVYTLDAAGGFVIRGHSDELGTGCVATGQTSEMTAYAEFTTHSHPYRFGYYGYCRYGTKNAPSMTLLGTRNPNAPLPICAKLLYTNADLLSVPATSDSFGTFTAGPRVFVPWSRALGGLKLYSQSYTVDAKFQPITVAVSNGVESTVPTSIPANPSCGTVYTTDLTSLTGTVRRGFGIVTRFDQ